MAHEVTDEVWAHSVAREGERLVLLAIADRADALRAVAWPSMLDIARRANITERQARRNVKALVERGELRRVKLGGKGYGNSTVYQVTVGRFKGVAHVLPNGNKGDMKHKKGDMYARFSRTPTTPEPSLTEIEPVVVDRKTGRLTLDRSAGDPLFPPTSGQGDTGDTLLDRPNTTAILDAHDKD